MKDFVHTSLQNKATDFKEIVEKELINKIMNNDIFKDYYSKINKLRHDRQVIMRTMED